MRSSVTTMTEYFITGSEKTGMQFAGSSHKTTGNIQGGL